MGPIMLGVETEYAFTALDRYGSALDRDRYAYALIGRVKNAHPHLRGSGSLDIYLGNGSRLYLDLSHPEAATPECTSPEEAVKYVRAGSRILARAAAELERGERRLRQALLFTCNVDYVATESTWGCHESYLYTRTSQSELAEQIIPHLVSRVVFAGAGGLNPRSPGIEFSLSPRAAHIEARISSGSTGRRGIYHTKDEPLAGPDYHRLHVLCGESLRSQLADYLRLGTTALVVRLCEAGRRPGSGVQLDDPLDAMRRFAADPTCSYRAPVSGSRAMTAVEIQRHYLSMVEASLGSDYMPGWAEEVCARWGTVLDGLESDPTWSNAGLDWPLKLALFRRAAGQRGFPWETMNKWNENYRTSTRKSSGLWGSFLKTRADLCEIDTRFGQLGPDGIFSALDRAVALDHRIVSDEEIAEACHVPPAAGRARLRGELVRDLSSQVGEFTCYWDGILDLSNRRYLNLANPFGEKSDAWKSSDENSGFEGTDEEFVRLRSLRRQVLRNWAPTPQGDG